MKPRKIYWDSSCFISFISGDQPNEAARASVCEDILNSAKNDEILLYTSVWTIAETIRPKSILAAEPLPAWTQLLSSQDGDGNLAFPNAFDEASKLWAYFKKGTAPTRLLPENQASRIRQMFDWKWIRLVQVMPAIAHKAVEIARAHNMKPGDAIHVATALNRHCDVIQRWDKDFSRTASLIPSEDPAWISLQERPTLSFEAPKGPLFEDVLNDQNEKGTDQRKTDSSHPDPVRVSDEGRVESKATAEGAKEDPEKAVVTPCECGCGEYPKDPKSRFLPGHDLRKAYNDQKQAPPAS